MGDLVPAPKEDDLKVDRSSVFSHFGYDERRDRHFYSRNFQWIPCEVAFREGGAVEITSYINNMHPRMHKPLYQSLQDVIAEVVPMWDACLGTTEIGSPLRDDANAEWIEPDGARPRDDDDSDLDEDDILNLDEAWRREHRTLVMPDIDTSYHARAGYGGNPAIASPEPPVNLRKQFATEGLQIVVKLANIHLTPEKPAYEGGAWHIEGQLNEHICASALYYYDSSNITESYLSFRETTSTDHLHDKPYDSYDWTHIERVYGIEQHGSAVQNLGRVNTREGRLLTFPNVFQHRVEPFSLADKSRPGHRKLLALFLVDPYLRIPSSANVPPQQKQWWREMVYGLDRVANLPAELAEAIVESAGDLPIDLEEAKQIRLQLMEERKVFVDDVDKQSHGETFDFCEH